MSETAATLPRLTYSPPVLGPPLAVRPEAWIGAASPLWGYFTGAAMLGVSWWWMTRWMQAPVRRGAVPAGPRLAELARTEATTPVIAELAPEPLPQAAAGPEASAPKAEPEKPSRKGRGETEPRPH